MAGVCQRWRDLALSHTPLWASLSITDDIGTHIRSPNPQAHQRVDQSLQWLQRAKNSPLKISIQTTVEDDNLMFRDIVLGKLPQILWLHLQMPLGLYRSFQGLPCGVGAILEHLQLDAMGPDSPDSDDPFMACKTLDLSRLFPKLNRISFSMKMAQRGLLESHVAFNTPWSQLRMLDIQEPGIVMRDLQNGLSKCRNLVSCNIKLAVKESRGGFHLYPPSFALFAPSQSLPLPAVALHCLQDLSIKFLAGQEDGQPWQDVAFFEPFTFPILQHLVVEGVNTPSTPHHPPASLLKLLEHSACSLKTLTILNFDLTGHTTEIVSLLTDFASLTSLSLKLNIGPSGNRQLQFLSDISYIPGINEKLPGLERFTLECQYVQPHNTDHFDVELDQIFHFLESRTPSMNSPFQRRKLSIADLTWSNIFSGEDRRNWYNKVSARSAELRVRGLDIYFKVIR